MIDFAELLRRIENDINSYVYEHHPKAIGLPLPQSFIDEKLDEMRQSLISPYWAEVRVWDPVTDAKHTRRCIVVADTGEGYLLAFDPDTDEFLACFRNELGIGNWGIRGGSVDCFISI